MPFLTDRVRGVILLLGVMVVSGCNMTLDINSKNAPAVEFKKSKGAEMTSGSNRQKTNRGYIVDSQVGHPFGVVTSKTSQNYTVYHSVKMGTSAE
jgi:hypothetical protein